MRALKRRVRRAEALRGVAERDLVIARRDLLAAASNSHEYAIKITDTISHMFSVPIVAIHQYRVHADSRTTSNVPSQVIADKYAVPGQAMKFFGSVVEYLWGRLPPPDIAT